MSHMVEALVRFVLGKEQRPDREVGHLHGCAWIFVEDVRKEFPDVKVDVLTATWPKSKKAAAPKKHASAASSSAAPLEQRVYAMDAFGVVVDPIAKLRSHSFDIGSVVGLKGVQDSIFTITAVSEQSWVTLKPWVSEHAFVPGSLGSRASAASAEQFQTLEHVLAAFESKTTAGIQVCHPGWKAERPIEEDVELSYERALATWAVSKISKYCKTSFPDVSL